MNPFTVTRDPFPHSVLDGYWSDPVLNAITLEFPHPTDPHWQRFANPNEVKLGGIPDMWGPHTAAFMDEVEALAPLLSESFRIPDLTMETVGGGYHLIPPGGLLNIHADFNRSPDSGLYRRLNFLTFLNRGWSDSGGHLELWPDGDGQPVDLAPEFNRTVVFETSDRSWHGHPTPAKRYRLSVAAYFFSPEPPLGYTGDHSTVWRRQR